MTEAVQKGAQRALRFKKAELKWEGRLVKLRGYAHDVRQGIKLAKAAQKILDLNDPTTVALTGIILIDAAKSSEFLQKFEKMINKPKEVFERYVSGLLSVGPYEADFSIGNLEVKLKKPGPLFKTIEFKFKEGRYSIKTKVLKIPF